MKLYCLGKTSTKLPELSFAIPPYEVDGVIVANRGELNGEERLLLTYYRLHGRPIGASLEEIEGLDRTNYAPIDCNFYDNFEAAIVQRRVVDLAYRRTDGSVKQEAIRLQDLRTHLTEEYVQLSTGEWLRLDRIVSVDGAAAGASCRFGD